MLKILTLAILLFPLALFAGETEHSGFSVDAELGFMDAGIGASYTFNNSFFISGNGLLALKAVSDDVVGPQPAVLFFCRIWE